MCINDRASTSDSHLLALDDAVPDLISHLNTLDPHLSLSQHAIKVQLNSGHGGCFPLHFDTATGLDDRALTAILYLNPDITTTSSSTAADTDSDSDPSSDDSNNSPAQTQGHLRLYPFPHPPLDIEPALDRLVLFDSRHMVTLSLSLALYIFHFESSSFHHSHIIIYIMYV